MGRAGAPTSDLRKDSNNNSNNHKMVIMIIVMVIIVMVIWGILGKKMETTMMGYMLLFWAAQPSAQVTG